jgi:hypothetical protein
MKLSNIMEMRRGHVYVPVTTIDRNSPLYKRNVARSAKIRSEITNAPSPMAALKAAAKWQKSSNQVTIRIEHSDDNRPVRLMKVNTKNNTVTVTKTQTFSWNMKTIPFEVYDASALSFKERERNDVVGGAFTYTFEINGDPIEVGTVPNPSYDQAKVDASIQKRTLTAQNRNKKVPPSPVSDLEKKYGRLRSPDWEDEDDI